MRDSQATVSVQEVVTVAMALAAKHSYTPSSRLVDLEILRSWRPSGWATRLIRSSTSRGFRSGRKREKQDNSFYNQGG